MTFVHDGDTAHLTHNVKQFWGYKCAHRLIGINAPLCSLHHLPFSLLPIATNVPIGHNCHENVEQLDFTKVPTTSATHEWKCLTYREFLTSQGSGMRKTKGENFK